MSFFLLKSDPLSILRKTKDYMPIKAYNPLFFQKINPNDYPINQD